MDGLTNQLKEKLQIDEETVGTSSAIDSGKAETSSAIDPEKAETSSAAKKPRTSSGTELKKSKTGEVSSATMKPKKVGTSSATLKPEATGTSSDAQKRTKTGTSPATKKPDTHGHGPDTKWTPRKCGNPNCSNMEPMPMQNDSEMTMEKAVEHFNKMFATSKQSVQDVLRLSKSLQFNPVPIEMAIAFINNEIPNAPYPIRLYLDLLKKEVPPCPTGEELTELEKATYKVWMLTLKTLIDEERPGYDFLPTLIISILAFFEPDNIPMGLFVHPEVFPNALNVVKQLNVLKEYSVISGPIANCSVHPLIQRVVRLGMTLSNIPPFIISNNVQIGLLILNPHLSTDSVTCISTKHLLLHAMSVWKYALKYDDAIREFPSTATHICRKLNILGRHKEQLQVAMATSPKLERIYGPTHVEVMFIKFCHAQALCRLDKNSESLEILNTLQPLAITKFGVNHFLPQLLLEYIAMNYFGQNNYAQQLVTLEALIAGRTITEGPAHKETLTAVFNKGIALANLGRKEDALEILKRIHPMWAGIPGGQEFMVTSKGLIDKLINETK